MPVAIRLVVKQEANRIGFRCDDRYLGLVTASERELAEELVEAIKTVGQRRADASKNATYITRDPRPSEKAT